MKKIISLIIGNLFFLHFAFSQNIQPPMFKIIEGKYYVESYGKDFLVNTSVVTVKLKDGVQQSSIPLNIIRTNKLGYMDIAVPDSMNLIEYLKKQAHRQRFCLFLHHIHIDRIFLNFKN